MAVERPRHSNPHRRGRTPTPTPSGPRPREISHNPTHTRKPQFTNAQTTPTKKGEEEPAPKDKPFPSLPRKTVAATYSPTPQQGSTISARRLNDRVRNETECDPPAKTTTETNTHNHHSTQTGSNSHEQASCTKCARTSTYLQRTSPRPISTGQLHPSQGFHTRPINPVVYRESYPLKEAGDLISKQASRLDAFSGYLSRT